MPSLFSELTLKRKKKPSYSAKSLMCQCKVNGEGYASNGSKVGYEHHHSPWKWRENTRTPRSVFFTWPSSTTLIFLTLSLLVIPLLHNLLMLEASGLSPWSSSAQLYFQFSHPSWTPNSYNQLPTGSRKSKFNIAKTELISSHCSRNFSLPTVLPIPCYIFIAAHIKNPDSHSWFLFLSNPIIM